MKKICVIGGGAAGMIAAGVATEHGDVYLFEKNKILGKKLLITGKGRCNVTNYCDLPIFMDNITKNNKFLYSAFNAFSPKDLMDFFENEGVPLKVERGNRVFPVSDKSSDIVNALKKFVKDRKVKIVNEKVMNLIIENAKIKGIKTQDNKVTEFDSVIVCTGGLSYPDTGSDGDGYRFAKEVGHVITPLKPSLVPLEIKENICGELQGLSLKNVKLSVIDKKSNKEIYNDFGEMLFTHFGVSGPLILSASAHLKDFEKYKYVLSIDLKPALTNEQLDNRIKRDFARYINKDFKNSLNGILPQKLIPVIIGLSGISPEQKVNGITKEQRKVLLELIKNFELTVKNLRPLTEAVITSGGVKVSEVDPKTMQSKIIKGLYFAGEVLDVDAYTGGFNLQIAFSTGYLAGKSV